MNSSVSLPNGVYTATLTPLRKDLSVHFPMLIAHCRHVLEAGSDGIALLGTTGEANSFSMTERKQILEEVIKGGIPGGRLMVGTGCCSLPETVELTRHAMDHGAGGVLVLPPFYYKQVTDEGLFEYYHSLIEQVDHPKLKIILYHFPKMSGVFLSLSLIQRLVKRHPGIIDGIKDSSGDFNNMKLVHENVPGFRVFAGTEKLLSDILEIGGVGCISATANVTIPAIVRVYAAWQKGEEFSALDAELNTARSAFEGFPFSGALKTYLAASTSNKDWLNIRPPNEVITDAELEIIQARINGTP